MILSGRAASQAGRGPTLVFCVGVAGAAFAGVLRSLYGGRTESRALGAPVCGRQSPPDLPTRLSDADVPGRVVGGAGCSLLIAC